MSPVASQNRLQGKPQETLNGVAVKKQSKQQACAHLFKPFPHSDAIPSQQTLTVQMAISLWLLHLAIPIQKTL